jgi:ABC-type iron transport system FetAB ATPase subunit
LDKIEKTYNLQDVKYYDMIQLNEDEQKTIDTIRTTPYMQKTIALVDDFVSKHTSKNKKNKFQLSMLMVKHKNRTVIWLFIL